MEKFIAERNVSRFKELLSLESDPNERRILETLLREERVRLAAAELAASAAAPHLVADSD
jgi:hypothetical protein